MEAQRRREAARIAALCIAIAALAAVAVGATVNGLSASGEEVVLKSRSV